MNDNKFKDMWQKADFIMGNSKYDLSNIENFMSSSSKQVSEKIVKLFQGVIVLKLLILIVLFIDIGLYYNVQVNIAYFCMLLIPIVGLIVLFEFRLLKKFKSCSDNLQNINSKLTNMLQFLKGNSFMSLISISSTYLFGFPSMMLLYFFIEYGELRSMGSLDIFVFPTLCFLGIIFTFVFNQKIIKSQVQHLELSMSDIDENMLPFLKDKMESQQKSERTITILIGFVVLLSFLVLIAILKSKGF